MKIDLDLIHALIASDITSYQIRKKTGISATTINELRNGKRKLENINLKTIIQLHDFALNYQDKASSADA